MFREARVAVLGGIENMGALTCPHCQSDVEIFPAVAESRAIWQIGVEKLAELPFDTALSHIAEQNRPLLVAHPRGEPAGDSASRRCGRGGAPRGLAHEFVSSRLAECPSAGSSIEGEEGGGDFFAADKCGSMSPC